MDEEDVRNWEKLCELIWGCAIGQAIHVSVELGALELLAKQPRRVNELAAATRADAWTLETVLRALAVYGVLSLNDDQRYELTRMGRLLLESSQSPSVQEAGAFFETIYRPLGELSTMVKTGRVAFNEVYGKSFYEHLAESPHVAAPFYDLMEKSAARRYAGLSSVVDFSNASTLIDLGGGEGSLLIQLLAEQPRLRGILVDLPAVAERARANISAAGLAERCTIAPSDLLTDVPGDGDIYLMAQVVNNYRDEEARRVLVNCHKAMPSQARLLIVEPFFDSKSFSRWRALVSLGVMAQRGGRSRTEAHVKSLLQEAGFEVESSVPLPNSPTSVMQALPRERP